MADDNKVEDKIEDKKEDAIDIEGLKKEASTSKEKAAKLEQDLEDLRLEVLSPEYLAYLDEKGKGKKKEEDKGDKKEVDPYANLTPSQIAAKVKAEIQADLDSKLENQSKEETRREVANFKATHSDYDIYRPIMRDLADLKENYDLSLQELYDKAKVHVKTHYGEPVKAKDQGRRASGEKPGGSGDRSVKKEDKSKSADQIADEAWDEVVGSSGLPPAI